MFKPTVLLFQVQENHATPYEADYYVPLAGHKYATLQEADDVVARLEAKDHLKQYRVYCDPGDVARALYEAGIAIRGAQDELALVKSERAASPAREAMEGRGPSAPLPRSCEDRPPTSQFFPNGCSILGCCSPYPHFHSVIRF
jgi:hypothetical protein